ncbi:MAG: TIGR02996 domain-containing protein [Archangium sp.]
MTTVSLQRAAKSKDAKVQLAQLLVAWRELKHPRIAELIDRVSAKTLEGVKPIPSSLATPKLMAALCEAAKSKDAVELGRMLAAEWPKSWQTLRELIEALASAPEDPRVAKRLVALVDAAPATFQSRGARAFWWPVFQLINKLKDPRQTELLAAQPQRAKSRYYLDYAQDWEANAAKVHAALKIAPLSKADDALLTELEVPFAASKSVEGKKKRSGEELLEAVWANPTDPAVRAVYGDWLVEQGDPRGELIALQLAAPTEKSPRRIELLIEKNWKKWLGPLSDWFRVAPAFELGFPKRGSVSPPSYRDGMDKFGPLLERPEWSTFQHLSMDWDDLLPPHELLAKKRFGAVRSLANVELVEVPNLAKLKPAPKLTQLELGTPEDGFVLPKGTWDAFEQLERLSIWPQAVECVVAGLGDRRLPTLEISVEGGHAEDAHDAMWKRLADANVEVVELRYYQGRVRVTRAASGKPFTRAHVLEFERMEKFLGVLPPGLTHLTCEPMPNIEAEPSALEHIEKTLKRYTKLEVRELPFVEAAPYAEVSLSDGAKFPDEAIPRLWDLLKEHFGVTFTNIQIGYSGSPAPLGASPHETLLKTARRRRTSWLYLAGSGDDARMGITREQIEGRLPVKDPKRFFDGLLALREFGGDELSVGERYDEKKFKTSRLESKRAEIIKLLEKLEAE